MSTQRSNSEAWTHFDRAFEEMDRAFKSFDWREVHMQSTVDESDKRARRTHKLLATSWRSRLRMTRLFLWLAWRILTRGKVAVKI